MIVSRKRLAAVSMVILVALMITALLAPAIASASMSRGYWDPWKGGFAHWYVYCKADCSSSYEASSKYVEAELQEWEGYWANKAVKDNAAYDHAGTIQAQTPGFSHHGAAGDFRTHAYTEVAYEGGGNTWVVESWGATVHFDN